MLLVGLGIKVIDAGDAVFYELMVNLIDILDNATLPEACPVQAYKNQEESGYHHREDLQKLWQIRCSLQPCWIAYSKMRVASS